jgi:hypothetical protein
VEPKAAAPGQLRIGAKLVKRVAASSAVAHFVGFEAFTAIHLELTPQALCCRLLRRLKSELLKHALISDSLTALVNPIAWKSIIPDCSYIPLLRVVTDNHLTIIRLIPDRGYIPTVTL